MILLLRGAPGVGKSTVASMVSEHLCGPPAAVVVEVDDLRGDLWHVPPVAGMPDKDRHHLAIAVAARLAMTLLGVGVGLVVVVDTFSCYGTEAFRAAFRRDEEVRAVTLLVGDVEHRHRLLTRPEIPGVYRNVATATAMNAELAAEQPDELIDTTGISPHDVAARVLRVLGGRSDPDELVGVAPCPRCSRKATPPRSTPAERG